MEFTKPHVVFLESQEGVESLFTRALREGAEANKWTYDVIFLNDASGKARNTECIRDEIIKVAPGLIAFLMDAPLGHPVIWEDKELEEVPKISLWYDDWMRSPRTLEGWDTWRSWCQSNHVSVYIWDGYWRKEWVKETGHEAHALHLSAVDHLLIPEAEVTPLYPEFDHIPVFVGTIPSKQSLIDDEQAFPPVVRHYIKECCSRMVSAEWPIASYEIADEVKDSLPEKHQKAINDILFSSQNTSIFNYLIWRWAKRIARLRGLRVVGASGPIAVLSGHRTERFALESELKNEMSGVDVSFRDTTEVPSAQWSGLFRSGKFQIQITDPQSCEGGIPFRVFECGAAGVPLLSDGRTELWQMFKDDQEVFLVENLGDLSTKAASLRDEHEGRLKCVGSNIREACLHWHTSKVRWEQIINSLQTEAEPALK